MSESITEMKDALVSMGYKFQLCQGNPNIDKPQMSVAMNYLWWKIGDGDWVRSEDRNQHLLVTRLYNELKNAGRIDKDAKS